MSRPEVEEILVAWRQALHGNPSERGKWLARRDELLDAVIASRTFDERNYRVFTLHHEPFWLAAPKEMDIKLRAGKVSVKDINKDDLILLTDGNCLKDEVLNFVDNPAQLSYVAVRADEPSRVLCLLRGRRDMTDEKSHAVFLTAATHPDARGSGLAAELTNFALDQMKNEGVKIARIYVYSNNHASLNAVKKLGFVHAGTVLRHHRDQVTSEYVDDLIFHKILDV